MPASQMVSNMCSSLPDGPDRSQPHIPFIHKDISSIHKGSPTKPTELWRQSATDGRSYSNNPNDRVEKSHAVERPSLLTSLREPVLVGKDDDPRRVGSGVAVNPPRLLTVGSQEHHRDRRATCH